MIQLATDPNANRADWRPAGKDEAKGNRPRARSGHAWPFLSKLVQRPAAPDAAKNPRNDSGS